MHLFIAKKIYIYIFFRIMLLIQGGAPFPEALLYRVRACRRRNKPLFQLSAPKINLIYDPHVYRTYQIFNWQEQIFFQNIFIVTSQLYLHYTQSFFESYPFWNKSKVSLKVSFENLFQKIFTFALCCTSGVESCFPPFTPAPVN